MKVTIDEGKYLVAVSGGVDSVVLLDILRQQKNLHLVVAHFDHGMRPDSDEDRKFVQELARNYSLPFEYAVGELGSDASEAYARDARYKYLRNVQKKHRAKAIIVAHHQDDLLETIILNLLRGTGRKGVTSLGDTGDIARPLLGYTKQEILDYAKKHNLKWREDSTNQDQRYQRNWVRHSIIAKLKPKDRQKLLTLHGDFAKRNSEIDSLLAEYTTLEVGKLSKQDVIMAPHDVAKELIASWLRINELRDFDQKTIERIVVGAKTLQNGKTIPVLQGYFVEVQGKLLLLKRER